MSSARIGILGGSGLYEMDGLERLEEVRLDTPFGAPSDSFFTGVLEGREVVFLSRHGRGHRVNPSEINYRANVWGMKKLGVEFLIAISACGSLRKKIRPGHFVVIDQHIDRTKSRAATFFEEGLVAHVMFADPITAPLAARLADAAEAAGAKVHRGGTYVCMEGPAFSTRAESNLYRSWGADVIGMTNLTEAKLAREAEIAFATLALATDYDCWYEEHGDVTVEEVIRILSQNVARAKDTVRQLCASFPDDFENPHHGELKYAILTARDAIPAEAKERLALLVGPYL
ncbi:MAG: S-methyl-5'-thioadenosine phosphorylase [Gemmatimonadetes bacterium]|nr:S-methyl-5'-thioadenosine phosphorylase [Gemmatimonadota bacterium]